MTLGFAVFKQFFSDTRVGVELASAVFDDPVQAGHALTYCNTKRATPGVAYVICELRELPVKPQWST